MSEWISVEDRLPEIPDKHIIYESITYLVTDGEVVGTCDFNRGHGCGEPWASWNDYGDINFYEITHWMPLPEPPNV